MISSQESGSQNRLVENLGHSAEMTLAASERANRMNSTNPWSSRMATMSLKPACPNPD